MNSYLERFTYRLTVNSCRYFISLFLLLLQIFLYSGFQYNDEMIRDLVKPHILSFVLAGVILIAITFLYLSEYIRDSETFMYDFEYNLSQIWISINWLKRLEKIPGLMINRILVLTIPISLMSHLITFVYYVGLDMTYYFNVLSFMIGLGFIFLFLCVVLGIYCLTRLIIHLFVISHTQAIV